MYMNLYNYINIYIYIYVSVNLSCLSYFRSMSLSAVLIITVLSVITKATQPDIGGSVFINRGRVFNKYTPRPVALKVSLGPHHIAVSELRALLNQSREILQNLSTASINIQTSLHSEVDLLHHEICAVEEAINDVQSVFLSAPKFLNSHRITRRMEQFPFEGRIMSNIYKIISSKINPGNIEDIKRYNPSLVYQRDSATEELLQESLVFRNESAFEVKYNHRTKFFLEATVANVRQQLDHMRIAMITLNHNQNTVTKLLNAWRQSLRITTARLQLTIRMIEKIRRGLQDSSNSNTLSPLVVGTEQLARILRLVRRRVNLGENSWPFMTKRFDLVYKVLPTFILPYRNSVLVILVIPFVNRDQMATVSLYEFVQVSVPDLGNSSYVYNVEAAGLAITRNNRYYAFVTQEEIDLCGHENVQFCHISSPFYSMEDAPSCLSVLYEKAVDLVGVYCPVIMSNPDQFVMKYLFDNKWLMYSPREWNLTSICPNDSGNGSFASNNTVDAGVSIVDIGYGCESMGNFVYLPPKFKSPKEFVRWTRLDYHWQYRSRN